MRGEELLEFLVVDGSSKTADVKVATGVGGAFLSTSLIRYGIPSSQKRVLAHLPRSA